MTVLQEYKCPCCGGAIAFNSDLQKLKCPFCDTEFEMNTLSDYDRALSEDATDEMSWNSDKISDFTEDEAQGIKIYGCKSCGGQIVGDETMAASACPYCGNPIVVMGQVSGELKPDYIIPFKVNKETAKKKFSAHLKGKKFLPSVFKDEAHIDEIKGIYVPYWLFNTEAKGRFRYRGTKSKKWSDNEYNYTETSYFAMMRAGSMKFKNIPINGSLKMDDTLMESLEPFDSKDAVPFQTAYLAGYFADRYDADDEATIGRANERVRNQIEDTMEKTVVGYSGVTCESSSIHLINGETHYAMYPVWILNATWRGEQYTFAMNGQTGKFVGDLPLDKAIATKWLFGLGLGLTAVFTVVASLLQLM